MIYLTHTRLMRESERTVHETATRGTTPERGICRQLVSDPARYSQWYARHERRMRRAGMLLRRESQILELRRACTEELHGAALVRSLRDFNVSSEERDRTLRLFYGVTDAREAAVLEHRRYLMAAASQLCATGLLALAGDTRGASLIGRYERAYAQYFGIFCEHARSSEARQRCLVSELLPEAKEIASRLLERILGGDLMPRTSSATGGAGYERHAAQRRLRSSRSALSSTRATTRG